MRLRPNFGCFVVYVWTLGAWVCVVNRIWNRSVGVGVPNAQRFDIIGGASKKMSEDWLVGKVVYMWSKEWLSKEPTN